LLAKISLEEMKREELTLVTTDLIETWPSEGKILFLGEWCRSSMDWENCLKEENHIIVPYHWNDRAKLKDDFDLLQNIRQSISPDLAMAMNKLHGTKHCKKYWDLLMGWWLSVFISVMIDRYSSIKSAVLIFVHLN
jgi:putative transferase (TIGR04331 family)